MSILSRAARVRAGALVLFVLLPLMTVAPVSGDEDAKERLSVRVFHVGALTIGRLDFVGERPPPMGADDVSNEDEPLFAQPRNEPIYPVGQADELATLIRGQVQPLSWERVDGADASPMGETRIIVRHRPDVLDDVARWLGRLEERVLTTMTIEVRARHGLPGEADRMEGPSLSMTAFANQRVSAFSGSQLAYISDYDVEVAKDSQISDPIVMVANLGLGVDARVVTGGSADALTAVVYVRLADLADSRQLSSGDHRLVDVPAFEVARARAVLDVVPGRWTPLTSHAGGSGWGFELRVTPGRTTLPAASSPTYRIHGGAVVSTDRALPVRMFDMHDLAVAPQPWVARPINLAPSNFTPVQPNESNEPCPSLPPEQAVDFIFRVSPENAWDDPASMEARDGFLIARNHEQVLSGIETLLAQVRGAFRWSVRTRLDVLEMPATTLAHLRDGAQGAFVLTADQARALKAGIEKGAVERVESVDVLSQDGAPNSVMAGRHTSYMADYEVELAEKSNLTNPVIQTVFSGLQLVVTASRTSGNGAVAMEIRATQTRLESPIRRMQAPRGYVELPRLDLFRVHTGLLVPAGGSVLLAAQGEGGMRRVFLLTPTVLQRR